MRGVILICVLVFLGKASVLSAQDSAYDCDSINAIIGVYSVQTPVLLDNKTIFERDTIELVSSGAKSTWRVWDKERRSSQEYERQKAVHRRLTNRVAVFYSTISELRIAMREKGEELNMDDFRPWEPTMMTEVMISDNIAKQRIIYAVEENMGIVFRSPLPELEWSMMPETSMIQGVKCEKAQTMWNNKVWTVWYSDSIPIMDGPFVFKGLPGLVFKVEDSEGHFKYELIGLKQERVAPSAFELPAIEQVMEVSDRQYVEYEAAKMMHRMGYIIGSDGTVYYIQSPVLYSIHP